MTRFGNFDVAVFSYTLSNTMGQELAETVRERCPGCPIIAISESMRADRRVARDVLVLRTQKDRRSHRCVTKSTSPSLRKHPDLTISISFAVSSSGPESPLRTAETHARERATELERSCIIEAATIFYANFLLPGQFGRHKM